MMYGCGCVLIMVATVALLPYVSAYPMRNGRIRSMATSSGTCASIGFTEGCCPPDADCKATDTAESDLDCYCSSDCHSFGDCCTDIVTVCPENPSTCTELGFVDRCCEDELNIGLCTDIVQSNGVTCSCQLSCFLDNNCCPDIGCRPTTCAEAGLDPGCCEGNCTVSHDGGVCYCDNMCREQGDCCADVRVDLTSECETPSTCTLTIRPGNRNSKAQQIQRRPRLQPLKLLERYQNRMKTYASTSRTQMLPAARSAFVNPQGMARNRPSNRMESRAPLSQAQRKKRN